MNDRIKHKITGQTKQPKADPNVNASVFLFFPTVHFFKTILARRTNGTVAFAPTHKANPTAKAKEPFFANAPDNNNHSSKNINSVSNKRKIIIVGDGFEKIQLVRKLDEKQLDVLLIDKINYHQF